MKALVTGAGGFIGSHLVEYLLEQGCEVRAMIRYTSYAHTGWLSELNEQQLSRVEIIRGDLKDESFCRKSVADCQYVFHLGALISIPFSYTNPADYIQTNVIGTSHLLQAARDSKSLLRFIQTSTSEVYGSAQYIPIDEHHPLHPQSPYAASKVGADALALSFHRSFELPVTVVRPFNTYGPRQSTRAVIPTIISQVLHNPVVKLGSTFPKRDFLFVKDTVRGFWEVGTHADAVGEAINLGVGQSVSIEKLFNEICILLNGNPELKTEDSRVRPKASEVNNLIANADKALQLCGWKSEITLKEGLRITADWIRKVSIEGKTGEYRI